jgi:hypothetical protein
MDKNDLYAFTTFSPKQRADLNSPTPAPPTAKSPDPPRRPSVFKKLKTKLSQPTPEEAAAKEAAKQKQAASDAETQARIERMRVGMAEANRTGIPQWVATDEYGNDQYVEGNLGVPEGWEYPEGAYNILIGPGKKVKAWKRDEMAIMGGAFC